MLWAVIGPAMLAVLAGLILWIRKRPLLLNPAPNVFPNDYALVWLVLITQNLIAQLVTGPHTVWNEMAFKIYYLLLMTICAVVLHHFNHLKKSNLQRTSG